MTRVIALGLVPYALDSPAVDRLSVTTTATWSNLNLNLVKGLALNFYTELSRLRDQVYLAADNVSDEEVLVRQRQLETGYRYYFNFGITNTFGSIYSPIVNPRFN